MVWQFLANVVLFIHALFIVFVVLGGFLTLHWFKVLYVHLPCCFWGVLLSWNAWICPLTPLEYWLRGQSSHQYGVLDRIFKTLVYPEGLTPEMQQWLAALLVLINVGVYGFLFYRLSRRE